MLCATMLSPPHTHIKVFICSHEHYEEKYITAHHPTVYTNTVNSQHINISVWHAGHNSKSIAVMITKIATDAGDAGDDGK